jgi:acetylornithine deacetylase
VQPGRPNVLATLAGSSDRHVLFEAHLDTVSPSSGQVDPFGPRREGDRLFGRGACDTKGSIAAMLLAVGSVLDARRPASVTVAFVMGEELEHEGARHLVGSGFRADAAVVGEPTALDVVTAHKGVVRFRMLTHGRAAHSADPGAGVNAIAMMAAVVMSLQERLAPRLAARSHPLLGQPTLNVGRIEGGLQVNVVPDRCAIDVDRRTLPGESWRVIREELEDVVAALAARDPGLRVQIEEPYQDTPGMETAPEAPIVQLAAEAVRRIDGRHAVRGVAYCTDGAVLAAGGTPCVVLGPGSIEQAHGSSEYVDIQQVIKAAAIYREIMVSF